MSLSKQIHLPFVNIGYFSSNIAHLMFRYASVFVLILMPLLAEAQIKRAFNLIEKLKYDQAEDLLYKSLDKDYPQPGEKYALSILYFTEEYYNYSVDSAYHYAVSAISDFKKSDEKTIEQLGKEEISLIAIKTQKDRIEEFTFAKAKKINTEEAYLNYLSNYPTSILEDSAIWYRNKAAFQDASVENNWQSYKSFMDKYPEAEDFHKAKDIFQKLIYEDKTSDGKLASFENFLTAYPDTPFRPEAEKAIFNISTATNKEEDYISFINKYPKSNLCITGARRIYYVSRSKGKAAGYEDILNKYLDPDSLNNLEIAESSFWFVIRENSSYKFLDQRGNKYFQYQSDRIPSRYLCGNITDPLLISYKGDSLFIINRLGKLIYSLKGIDDLQDLGFGYIQIKQGSKYGLITQSGNNILSLIADEIKLIHGQYAAFRVNDLWGLISINGITLFEPSFTNIEEFSTLIRISQKDFFALVKTDELNVLMDKEDIRLDFHYEDAELLPNGSIITYSGEKQGILSTDLEILVPEEEQELIQLDKGLLIETKEGFRFISSQIDINPSLIWESADYNPEWLSLKGPNGWTLISIPLEKVVEEYIDSIRLLNRTTSLVNKNAERRLFFHSGKTVKLERGTSFEIISSPPSETVESEFYTMLKEKDMKLVLDSSGDTLIAGNIKDIKAFGKEYLVITERKGSGLFDSKGRRLLPSEYDGIANYEAGGITLLKNGKLGYYRLRDSTYIPPLYSKSLKQYNDQLFIASLKDGYGIIDVINSKLTEFAFEEISYFNDSTAWVRNQTSWKLLKFYIDTYIEEEILEYSQIENKSTEYTYIETLKGKGVLRNKTGTIINATFNEVMNVGSAEHPLFMCAKYIAEADYYVVAYYDENGKILFRNGYPTDELPLLVCEK